MNGATVKDAVAKSAALTDLIQRTIAEATANGKDIDAPTAFVWATVAASDPLLVLIGQHAADIDGLDESIIDLTATITRRLSSAARYVEVGDDVPSSGVSEALARLDSLYVRRALTLDHFHRAVHAYSRRAQATTS